MDSYVVYNSHMQLANSRAGDPILDRHIRRATRGDAAAVQRLLRLGVYVHVHVDWRLPGSWLDRPGFYLYGRDELVDGISTGEDDGSEWGACLAVAAEPPPTAWVRVAAVASQAGFSMMEALFNRVLNDLDPAIDEIAWFLTDYWPLQWLERIGFVQVSDVIAYRKDGLTAPSFVAPPDLAIRPLLIEDIPALEAIEAAAFEPRWRHSADDLNLAWRHSICFTVATLNDIPVAFQFSTGGEGVNAHLSRMTVHPDYQGFGIGAALLANALENYRLQNITTVTLNTQSDNLASRRLYERFGFHPTGFSYPVWSYFPNRPSAV